MLTYQDLLKVPEKDEQARMDFVYDVIQQHKQTELYETAVIADEYDRHQNRTILQYQKMLHNLAGELVPDEWTANYKLASRFFNRFITQENQYLLGNGITWGEESTAEKLGKTFDIQMQKLGKKALSGGVSFGFYNFDHLDVFGVTEYAPLYDENDGALKAGVRFWQIDDTRPLRATLYEIDGYTDYIWNMRKVKDGQYELESEVLHAKRAYKLKIAVSEADGEQIYDGENYPSFPIVPLWGNPYKQSEIVGLREQIDCYDLIKSGYANNVDEASIIYWTLNNAGGMDDIDLAQFVEKMRKLHAAQTEDGVSATPNTMDAPYQSREALLATIRADLYEDAMALDTKNISNGAVTATQIQASYDPLNSKTDEYEYCVREFLNGILAIAGIEDEPTFTRSVIVNRAEEAQLVLQSAQFLQQEYVTEKLLTILGDGDRAEEMIQQMQQDELDRFNAEMGMMEGAGAMEEGADEETEEDIEADKSALSEYSEEVIKMLEELMEG